MFFLCKLMRALLTVANVCEKLANELQNQSFHYDS